MIQDFDIMTGYMCTSNEHLFNISSTTHNADTKNLKTSQTENKPIYITD
jgi:hypothetical protein